MRSDRSIDRCDVDSCSITLLLSHIHDINSYSIDGSGIVSSEWNPHWLNGLKLAALTQLSRHNVYDQWSKNSTLWMHRRHTHTHIHAISL